MGTLTSDDREIYLYLRGKGLLKDVDAHRINLTDGAILVTCADGDQLPDIFGNFSEACLAHRATPRVHVLGLNGGALLLPRDTPLNTANREDLVLLSHIRTAIKLKNIRTVALYAHAPCGAAGLAKLSLLEVVNMLAKAKARVKEEIPESKVACFMHVDRGAEEGKRTYFISGAEINLLKLSPTTLRQPTARAE